MAKAQDYVNQCMDTVNNAVNTLQQAMTSAENPSNKSKIQDAINNLNAAKQQLSGYQD